MKKDYKYLLSTGPDMSHLFDVQHFARLGDALDLLDDLHKAGRAFRVERMGQKECKITDSKQYAKRLADEKRKAYCEKHGYKNSPHIGTEQGEEELCDECGGNGSVCGVRCDYCEGDGYISQ